MSVLFGQSHGLAALGRATRNPFDLVSLVRLDDANSTRLILTCQAVCNPVLVIPVS